jgi:hypothetical protein
LFTKTRDSPAIRDCFSSYSWDDIFRSSICAWENKPRSGLCKM